MPQLKPKQTYSDYSTTGTIAYAAPGNQPSVESLTNADSDEVLKFLAHRPLHTVMMAGMICDNGMVSEFNRGDFYAYRNRRRELEGVALIGHLTMIEAQTKRAGKALADKAKEFKKTHVLFGEEQRLDEFLKFYSNGGQSVRAMFRELLLSLENTSLRAFDYAPVRRARAEDLNLIIPIQAELATAESGVNPLQTDAAGFRSRCARRIEMGRTWVIVENNEIAFKADVMVRTNRVNYLEGVYVAPSKRGRGFGSQCLSQLCRNLFQTTDSVCLMTNESNVSARSFYEKIGFDSNCFYQNIFLQKN